MSNPSQTAEPVVSLRGVGLCYQRKRTLLGRGGGEFWAIKDASLDLHRGETLGVIGRNGSGKSTLLKILAGILRPDRGEMRTDGSRSTLLSLQVGFVPYLSGRENIILSGLLLGMPRTKIEDRLESIIEFAELGEFIDEPINTYSAGMRARLGFSTAIQVEPEILLLDEVLGVGDAAFVKKSTAALREKVASQKTVVLVSHAPATISDLCDRAIWIHSGETQCEGNPEEVLKAYRESPKGPRAHKEGRE